MPGDNTTKPVIKAVILAAGLGTRLRPLTDRIPKCLVPIAGRPLLDYWLNELVRAGIPDALVNTHAHRPVMQAHIEAVNRRAGLRLWETFEPELLGSAGTIAANPDFADGADVVIIIYADNFSAVDLARLADYHHTHDDPMTMMLFRSPAPRTCGIAELDEDHRIVNFVEKPDEPVSDMANAGVYVLDAEAYRQVAQMQVFDFGFDVLPRYVGRMRGWLLEGYHRDIGSTQSYQSVQAEAAQVLRSRGYLPDGRRPAVFFDRDGTLIESVHYLSDPDQVALVPDAAQSIRLLHDNGFACVIVTNQSAIGRGMIDEARLAQIHLRLGDLLEAQGAVLDAIYFCPLAPQTDDRTVIEHEDRKPGPGMLNRAAEQLGLDISASWMVGDSVSDILAGHHAGTRGNILLGSSQWLSDHERQAAAGTFETADSLTDMVRSILEDQTVHHVADVSTERGR